MPLDGQGDPANIALALAKGARQMGAQVFEQTKAMGVTRAGRRITAVQWQNEQGESGSIACENVINCGGMWGHEVGRMLGINVPLQACEHFYIVSEAIEGLSQMPVLRVPDECAYYKEDAGKMLLGAFEPVSKPWAMEGIPADFEFDQLPEDFDHFEPILEKAVSRMPMLGSAGIHTFFNGPESFTPDDAYHLGLAPEMDNVWVAAGFNSVGIQSAGGAGQALGQWMEDGQKPFDLGDVDIGRMQPFQGNKHYLFERSKETLGLLYADHFPYLQKKTARGVRRTPFHHHLKENYINQIKWIEALGDYVKLITNNKSFVILSTMKAFENELPKGLFLRIHKSYIINLKKVERYDSKHVEIEKMKLPLSRTRKTQLSKALDVIVS